MKSLKLCIFIIFQVDIISSCQFIPAIDIGKVAIEIGKESVISFFYKLSNY